MGGGSLVGKPESVKGLIQPITTAISGEHPSGTIAAVCSWREPKDKETCFGVAKPRDRSSPIGPITKLFSFRLRDGLAMVPKPRTRRAPANRIVKKYEPMPGLIHGEWGGAVKN